MREQALRVLLGRKPARPWAHGGKIPWDDPDFSARMLREHLSQDHDRASRRAAVIDEQVGWIHDTLLGGRVGRVLDIGCGPGLYTSRLASRGHRCVGIDFSPASIEHAKQTAAREGLACDYRLADVQSTSFEGRYDTALVLFGELNTFPREQAVDLLGRVGAALAPGARVVLEVHTEEAVRSLGSGPPTWGALERSVFADDPHLFLRECFWHEAESAAVERHFVLSESSDTPLVLASTTQAYTSEEYEALLHEAGLEVAERHPCSTGRTQALDPSLFVLVAVARGAGGAA